MKTLLLLFLSAGLCGQQYSVNWTVAYSEQVGCPAPEPYTDPVTQEVVTPITTTLGICYDEVRKELSKIFYTQPEAEAFGKMLAADTRVKQVTVTGPGWSLAVPLTKHINQNRWGCGELDCGMCAAAGPDANPLVEVQTISKSGKTITLSSGPTVEIHKDEIQTLGDCCAPSRLTLSGGNVIRLDAIGTSHED